MTATATPVTFRTEHPNERVTLPRVIRSEWTKLWTLRSTRWSLLLAFVAQAGLGPLIALIEMARWSHLTLAGSPDDQSDRPQPRWLASGAARDRDPRSHDDHRRVPHRHDPLEPDGGAKAPAGAVGQAARVLRA